MNDSLFDDVDVDLNFFNNNFRGLVDQWCDSYYDVENFNSIHM